MVRKNENPRKDNVSKEVTQTNETVQANSHQKSFQRNGEFYHRDNNTRNNRPPRENQQRENNQKDFQQRDNQRRENPPRENQFKENIQRENQHKDSHQRNFHRENTQNRDNFKEGREPFRQHYQKQVIKPRADETVEDIAADIGRIAKEIELELKEIKSLRLGI